MSDISFKSATELSALLADKKISAREILSAQLERVRALDGKIGAFLSLDEKDAFAQADAADARRAAGAPLSALDGVPVDDVAVSIRREKRA